MLWYFYGSPITFFRSLFNTFPYVELFLANQVPSDVWLSELIEDATAAAACLLTAAAFAAAAMATTDCCCKRYDAKFDDIDECDVTDVPADKGAAEQCIPGGIDDAVSKDAIEKNGKDVWCPG